MTLEERLQQVFEEEFPDLDAPLGDTTVADDVPGWDSLRHISLMFRIEQTFGVQFVGDEMASMANVGELKELLRSKGCQ